MPSSSLPISALPEIAKHIDGAERILKADIARMKKLLGDRGATLPLSIAEAPLQGATDSLDLLAAHSRQLARWQEDAITDAERVEVVRPRAIIPGNPPAYSAVDRACDRARQTRQDQCRVPTEEEAALSVEQ
jgi:putative ubiquitin-RnfH superfamily antitoxin RatB of RatAB toxin-antitoxin module